MAKVKRFFLMLACVQMSPQFPLLHATSYRLYLEKCFGKEWVLRPSYRTIYYCSKLSKMLKLKLVFYFSK